ncbi:MAG: HprK-related kinase A, partial [Betaproteobacteria bacterium]
MIVSDLPAGELRRQLRGGGARLRLGPVVANIASPFRAVETAVALHYGAHEIVAPTTFADFHVAVDPVAGLRRWFRPQAVFRFDA